MEIKLEKKNTAQDLEMIERKRNTTMSITTTISTTVAAAAADERCAILQMSSVESVAKTITTLAFSQSNEIDVFMCRFIFC